MENEEVKKVSYKQLVWFFIVVIILWAASWFYTTTFVDTDNQGVFGDMFGGINALFSGLAFAGVIFAILLQRRELELQREELIETRKELSGQREALEKQNVARDKQIFESTFFQMVNLHHQIVNSIDIRHPRQNLDGRECFKFSYEQLGIRCRNIKSSERIEKLDIENTLIEYESEFKRYQSNYGHYFRNLYHIIKFIDRSIIDDKKMYTTLVRAQLSSYELLMLFYNCLSDFGVEKFKPLIETYHLLKNFSKNELIEQHHTNYYKESAFGEEKD